MKQILYTFFAIISFSVISVAAHSQACIPNNDTIAGIEPDTLAIATTGVPYNEVIYFRLPADTVVPFIILGDTFLLHVCIDSLTIDSVHGLPEGLSFGCNVPWCSVLGGSNGCAAVSGTTQNAGIFPLEVFVTVYTNDCYGFALPKTSDTVAFYYIEVQEPSGIRPFASGNSFTAGNCFPNPASNEISLPVFLPVSDEVVFTVLDPQGRIQYKQNVHAEKGYTTSVLDISILHSGAYFLRIESGESQFMRSFVVSK